jgi:glycosyltransferase involved in cell wall biosynthesis
VRIIQLVENLEVGGIERLVVDLAKAQKADGHRPSVYCLIEPGALAAELKHNGIPVTAFHKQRGWSVKTLRALIRRLAQDAPEILHTHNPGVHPYGAIAGRISGVPVIVNTRHGTCNSLGHAFRERYYRAVLPLTSHVVFVSDHSKQASEHSSVLKYQKASVIHNGIALREFLLRPARPGSVHPRIRFGTIGRFVPVKGHCVLIDAFARVAALRPDAQLRIAGQGPLESDLKSQVEQAGLGNRIRIEKMSSGPANILSELDVFVLPSLSEGLPLVVLEAMAAGLPLVATSVGGVPEVAPPGIVSWLCEPSSADQLAAAMLEAANSPHLLEIGRTARSLALQRFDSVQMHRGYEALYAKLLPHA